VPRSEHDDLASETSRGGSPSGLRWPLFLGVVGLALVIYWPTWVSMYARWSGDPTYSHGPAVAAVSAWMVWRAWRRGELEGTRPSWFALLPLALAGLLWLAAKGASILIVQQLMMPTLLLGAAWAVFGWRGFIALLVPIGLLYLVLPVWEPLRPPLRDISSFVVGNGLQAGGIPVHLHGNRVDLPAGSFDIAEGCSGLNVLLVGAALAVGQAYLFLGAAWARALLIGMTLLAAMAANWLRIAIIIVAGHRSGMDHWLIDDHYHFGWVTFTIMMVPMLYLWLRLERISPLEKPASPGPAVSFRFPAPQRTPVIAALGLLLVPGLAWSAVSRAGSVAAPPVLPVAAGEWRLDGDAGLDWRPLQPGHSTELQGRYTDGVHEVDAWVFYYERQSSGRKLIGHGNAMARPEDGWLMVSEMAPGELRLVTGRLDDRLIRYRYEVNGRITVSAARVKLYELVGNLSGRPSAYGTYFSARCGDAECADAREALQAFEGGMAGRLPAMGLE
jgi:exosortase A